MILPGDIALIEENRDELIAWCIRQGDTPDQAEATVAILLDEVELPSGAFLD